MRNYLNNNSILIEEFHILYKNGININTIVNQFESGELIIHNGFDYGRFRAFLDSCLLLFNKEKLNYYTRKYSYKSFFDKLSKDEELTGYLRFIKEEKISSDISGTIFIFLLMARIKHHGIRLQQ